METAIVVCVLGWQLPQDSIEPGPALVPRLEKGIQTFRDYRNLKSLQTSTIKLLLTGGFVTHRLSSEAAAMKRWLLRQHADSITPQDLWLEDRSDSTIENALFVRHVLRLQDVLPTKENGKTLRLVVVTSDFHCARASLVFATAFGENHSVVIEFRSVISPAEVYQIQMPKEENLSMYKYAENRLLWLREQIRKNVQLSIADLVHRGATELLRHVYLSKVYDIPRPSWTQLQEITYDSGHLVFSTAAIHFPDLLSLRLIVDANHSQS